MMCRCYYRILQSSQLTDFTLNIQIPKKELPFLFPIPHFNASLFAVVTVSHLLVCVHTLRCRDHGAHAGTKGQPVEVTSLLPLCRFIKPDDPGHQVLQGMPLLDVLPALLLLFLRQGFKKPKLIFNLFCN